MQVTGVALVAVHHGDTHSPGVRQGLVSLQTFVDVVNPLPQFAGIDKCMNTAHSVGTAGRRSQPFLPETCAGGQFESVEASHSGPEHDQCRFHHDRSRDARLRPSVRDRRNHCGGEIENPFRPCDQTPEYGYRFRSFSRFHSSSETSSNRRCSKLIVLDGLPNTRLPGLRDTGLARLPAVALNQIQGPMEFAFGAMAGGLAALARPLRQSSAKKPAAGNQLRNPGTDLPFGGREGGADKNIAQLLYANNIQENWQQSSPNHNANMLPSPLQRKNRVKRRHDQMFLRFKAFGCGIASPPGAIFWRRMPKRS